MNEILAGLLAAVPLAVVGLIYMWRWGGGFVAALTAGNTEQEEMTPGQMQTMFTAAFGLAPFILGVVAGLVYRWLQNPVFFLALALGLAVLFSIVAVMSSGPLKGQKVVMNFLVALDFGIFIPLLAG